MPLQIDIMFLGEFVGKKDDKGREIKCGDIVEFYQYKEGYLETHSQDGWGREVILCRHDQYEVPPQEKTIRGVVKYDPKITGFIVEFEDYLLDTFRKTESLFMLGKSINAKKDRLIVIATKKARKQLKFNRSSKLCPIQS